MEEKQKPASPAKKRALGKGLGALIPTAPKAADSIGTDKPVGPSTVTPPPIPGQGLRTIPLDDIHPASVQPRTAFDQAALEELAESIAETGLIQPIVVREADEGYEIIAGERRYRASKLAGLDEVPVVVKDLTDAESFAIALVENIQREDLNALEEATAFQRLIDVYGFTQQSLATKIGKSRSAVANTVRLLQLPPKVQAYVLSGELSSGHARALVGVAADEAAELAELIVKHGYTVREAESLAKESRETQTTESGSTLDKSKRKPVFRDDAQVREIVDALQTALGTKVKVKDRNGKGHIEVHYANYDVLQDVLDRLITE